METQEIIQNETPYAPTAEQVERTARLRRFNLLFVYVPLGLVAALFLALIVIMLIMAINPPDDRSRLFLSGLADAALALALLPFLIVGAALVGLAAYGLNRARKNGTAPVRRTQTLLWRTDSLVGRLRARTQSAADLVVQPFLSINGSIAYVKMLITQLVKMVKRS